VSIHRRFIYASREQYDAVIAEQPCFSRPNVVQ